MRRIRGFNRNMSGLGFTRPVDVFGALSDIISSFAWHADQDAWACPIASNFKLDLSVTRLVDFVRDFIGKDAIKAGIDDLMRSRLLGVQKEKSAEGSIGAEIVEMYNLLSAQSEEIRDVGDFVRGAAVANGFKMRERIAPKSGAPHPIIETDAPMVPDDVLENWFLMPAPNTAATASLSSALMVIDAPAWGLNILPPLPPASKSETGHAFGEKPAGQSEGFKKSLRAVVSLVIWYILQPSLYWLRAHLPIIEEHLNGLRTELKNSNARVAGPKPEDYDTGSILKESNYYIDCAKRLAKIPVHPLIQGALSGLRHQVKTELGSGPCYYAGCSDPGLEQLKRYVHSGAAIGNPTDEYVDFDIKKRLIALIMADRSETPDSLWAFFASPRKTLATNASPPYSRESAGGLGQMWDPRTVIDALANLSISIEDVVGAAAALGVVDVPAGSAESWALDLHGTGVEWTDGTTMSIPPIAAIMGLSPVADFACAFAASQGPEYIAEFGLTEASCGYTAVPFPRQYRNKRKRSSFEQEWMHDSMLMGEETTEKTVAPGSDLELAVLGYWCSRLGLKKGTIAEARASLDEHQAGMRYLRISPDLKTGTSTDDGGTTVKGVGVLTLAVDRAVVIKTGGTLEAAAALACGEASKSMSQLLTSAKASVPWSRSPYHRVRSGNGRFVAKLQPLRAFAFEGLTYTYRVEPRGAFLVNLEDAVEADLRYAASEVTPYFAAVLARFQLRGDMVTPRPEERE